MKLMSDTANAFMKQLTTQCEGNKTKMCEGILENGKIQIFFPPKLVSELICSHCQGNNFLLTVENPRGDYFQRTRKIAFCMSEDCLKKNKGHSKPISAEPDWKASGIPETHLKKTLDNYTFKRRSEDKFLRDFVSGQDWCCTLWGESGKGKTHLAVGVMKNYHLCFKKPVVFVNVDDIMTMLREAQTQNENEYRIVEKYGNYEFLVLDDLGFNRGSDWQVEKINEILSRRHRKNLKTVITTNKSFEELEDKYGIPIVRRLAEGGSIEIK